jgi:hypothetical protein
MNIKMREIHFSLCVIFGKSNHKDLPANDINVSPVVWKNKVWILQ